MIFLRLAKENLISSIFSLHRTNCICAIFWIFAALFLPINVQAKTVYTYTGPIFESFAPPFNANSRVTGVLTTDSPMPPDSTYFVGPSLPPGFTLYLNVDDFKIAYPQVNSSGYVTTDSSGALTDWYLQIYDSAGNMIYTDRTALRFDRVSMNGSLGIVRGDGSWAMTTVNPTVQADGAGTRITTQSPFSSTSDNILGGIASNKLAISINNELASSQAASGQVNSNVPTAGTWSSSTYGTGASRALAFRTYHNASGQALSFKVNATVDGQFIAAPFKLPAGTLRAAAALHVIDAPAFIAKLGGSTAIDPLLNGYTPAQAADPTFGFTNLRGLFTPDKVLGTAQTSIPTPATITAPGTVPATPLSTGLVTVPPNADFTVVYDIATSSAAQTTNGKTGSGTANFLNTLKPADAQFTDASNVPIAAGLITPTTPDVPLPVPSAITLAPTQTPQLAGKTTSVKANVQYTGPTTPLSNTAVQFVVTAGPNMGKQGIGITDDTGVATFNYIGDHDIGKDTIQARIGALQSTSTTDKTWTAAKCPRGQDYWIKNTGSWPASASTITVAGVSYTQASLLPLLKQLPKNASFALFQQDVVTRLNTANDGDTTSLTIPLLDADKLLAGFDSTNPQGQLKLTQPTIDMLALAARMLAYNVGLTARTCKG